MATPTQLFRGAAALSSTTLFTNSGTTVITAIAVVNSAAVAATYTLVIGGVDFAKTVSIPANTTQMFDNVRQVLTGAQTITGLASATTVHFHIAGAVL